MVVKTLVMQAVAAFLVELNPAAIDRYVSPHYIQHSPLVAAGVKPVKDLVVGLKSNPAYSYKTTRVIAEGPLVVLHGSYTGFGEKPLVAFDIFRVENGKLIEHWDAMQPEVEKTVSGHTQLDGSTQIADEKLTGKNRDLVAAFLKDVMIGGQYDKLTHYISTEKYIQHNPGIGDGLSGLGKAVEELGKAGIKMEYAKVHQIVAEGNFVFARSEGKFGGKPTVYNDLWRIENGKIVEHWDVMQDIPAKMPHNNGLF